MIATQKRNRRTKGASIADRYLTAKERKYLAKIQAIDLRVQEESKLVRRGG